MPPVKKINFVVILFDVGAESDFVQRSRDALLDICSDKLFSNSGDEMKLILFNTEGTDYGLEYAYNYQHITEPFEEAVLCVPEIVNEHITQDVEPGNGNWLEALQVAVQVLIKSTENRKGILTKQLIFVSDMRAQVAESSTSKQIVADIKSNLRSHKIYLYAMVGPRVTIPRMLNSVNDIRTTKQEFALEDANDNLRIVKSIIDSIDTGIMCDFTTSTEIVKSFKKHKGLQPWYCSLSIGTVLEIPTASRRLIRPPKVTFNEESQERKGVWKWVDANDTTIEIAYDNVIGGFEMHNKFVPLTDDVKKMFKQVFSKCFKIFGVFKMKDVPQHFTCGETPYCVTGDHRNLQSVQVFNTLIDYLHDRGLCLRAGKVYAKNCNMRKMILVPKPDFVPKCFLAAELPSADDVPVKYEEREARNDLIVNPELMESTCRYLDSIDLELNQIPFSPSLSRDIYVTRLYNKLLEKTSGIFLESGVYNVLNTEFTPEIDDNLINACKELPLS